MDGQVVQMTEHRPTKERVCHTCGVTGGHYEDCAEEMVNRRVRQFAFMYGTETIREILDDYERDMLADETSGEPK